MSYKDWPYWLKGGVIIAGLYIIINILMFILGYASGGEGLIIFIIISLFPIGFLLKTGNPESVFGSFGYIIIDTLIFFVLGALIGWIVGKIKRK